MEPFLNSLVTMFLSTLDRGALYVGMHRPPSSSFSQERVEKLHPLAGAQLFQRVMGAAPINAVVPETLKARPEQH